MEATPDHLFPNPGKFVVRNLIAYAKNVVLFSEPKISDKIEHALSERKDLFGFFSHKHAQT